MGTLGRYYLPSWNWAVGQIRTQKDPNDDTSFREPTLHMNTLPKNKDLLMHDATPQANSPKKSSLYFILMPFIGLIACFLSACFHGITTDAYATQIAANGRLWRDGISFMPFVFFYLPVCLISPTLTSHKKFRFLLLVIPMWYPVMLFLHCPLRSIHLIITFLFGYAVIYAYENINSFHPAKEILFKATQSFTLWVVLCISLLLFTGNYTNLFTPGVKPDDQKVFILQLLAVMLPFSFFHIFQQKRTHRIATAAVFLIMALFLSIGQTAPLTARPLPIVKKITKKTCDVTITGGEIDFIDPVISCGEAEIEANLTATVRTDRTTEKAGKTVNFEKELSICVEGHDNKILRMCKTSSIRISNLEEGNLYVIWTARELN